MTNREKLESLDTFQFSIALYEIVADVGWRYTISTKGTAEWLAQPYEENFWKRLENIFELEKKQ